MNYCQARHCDKYLYFPGEKRARFYRPYQCGEQALPGDRVCALCKAAKPSNVQLSRGFNHGFIGDLIPPNSHAYGGEWYLSMVAKRGEPAKEVLEEATEHIEEDFETTAGPEIAALFRAGMSSTKVEMPTRLPKAEPARSQKGEPKARQTKKKTQAAATGPSYIQESCAAAEAKIAEMTRSITPRIVEALSEPLDVCEVEYIDVETLKFDGDKYYKDLATNYLYKRLANKGMGELVGKFNEEALAIMDVD